VRVARSSLLWLVLCLVLPAAASAAVQPSLTATGSDAELGNSVHVTATLSGGQAPTGSIAFSAFASNDPTCVGPAVFTSSATVNDNGEYTSANFTPADPGTYRWNAEYEGDSENEPASSLCTATSVISKATPSLATVATSAVAGAAIHDTATLSGGVSPTGSLVFEAFGPNDVSCSGAAAFAKTVAVSGNGEYGSGDFTNAAAGTYRWTVSYSGDADNDTATSPCNSANETSTVSKASPGISTAATSATIGAAIKDTATLSGGFSHTGQIVFKAFGPGDATCANTPAFTFTVNSVQAAVASYESGNFTPATAGTYRWTAEYSGDANNNGATSACNAPNETSTVSQAITGLSSTATSGAVGAAIKDTATLSGGVSPTGTLTFKAFGPNDATCAETAAYTNTVTVAGNAQYGSGDFATSQAGTYRWTVSYSGDANNTAATSPCNALNETSTVGKASPAISTTATNATVGGAIKDTATIASGVSPGGTVTFKAFGPNDATCSTTAAYTKTVTVAGNGSYGSENFTPATVGTYRWTAEYSGDADNNAVTSACNAANETSTVTAITPSLSSTATNATVAAAISDSATLSGGVSPTGSLTFKAFGPNDATCAGTAAYTKTVTVAGNGSYGSENFTPATAGTYRWTIAYSGDANNGATTSACNALNETSTVSQAITGLSSTATSGAVGGAIKDTATLSGGASPTGTLTFKAFGPNDATCAGTAAFTKAVTVNGNGDYGSTDFTTSLAGTYRWTIAYSGDTNNAAVTSACNAANETSTVGKASPAITSTATNGAVGSAIKDTATIAVGVSPTGNLVFKVFAPADATCSAAVAFTKTVTVNGNGAYSSTDFVTNATGTYRWTAEYSGDANNNTATSACNAPNETSTVSKASPTISSVATSSIFPGAISDTATIASGFKPSGNLTFKAFGPSDAACAGPAAYEKAVALTPGNDTYTSGSFTNPQIGSYRWTVSYSGDAENNSASSPCNATNETSTVAKVSPQITVSTANAAIGGAIASFATFGGGLSHTGQVTLRAYPPSDLTCSGSPAFAALLTVTPSNNVYASGGFIPALAGAYRWTASYSGDDKNAAETTACGAAIASVAPAAPAVSVHISTTSITAGEGVRDSATISGGLNPGGTITFRLFGSGDTSCGGSPALTSTVAVAGNGTYTSASLVPRAAGDYRFTVTYSGDANNTAVAAPCGVGGEFVRVQKRTPTLKARAAVSGKKIVAKATLGAADSPQGKVTFRIYAPGDNRCSRKPVFSSQRAVHGSGNYSSAGYRFDAAGLYRFTVAYSGDERNKSVKKGCATRGQSIRVP
jgi:hypothetical protein